ncbi:type I polyketide synthase [Streptomyces sp. NPDC014894]|uniref:type I polyketide synthase n=1 Tax=Streptomyces sp. NPDC014894 TaxID=3364931 RepID=UPI003701F69B
MTDANLSDPGPSAPGVPPDAVAVIGMAGRFPGAPSVDALWRNLCEGRESVTVFSPDRLAAAGVPERERSDPAYVPARAVLDGVELFDSAFFGFSARDADLLDPQQRIFLECAWEAVEHAGYDTARHPGHTAVFGGAAISTYLLGLLADPALVASVGGYRILLANDKDHLTTRVAHLLDLRGPAVTVQTSCSTSLVAVHLATQALLTGQCDMALAGGVAVSLPQTAGYRYEQQGIMAPDGHCRAFDASAAGTVPGAGAGVVVLKRAVDALADGDTLHALILGSAINNDGAAKSGYTAPSARGQAEVIAEAIGAAGVDPGSIGYVEAHGTGTALGDPIEVAALAEALERNGAAAEAPDRDGAAAACVLGSVKTNLGHLDVAAGVTGLIKATLALREGVLPPTLHFEKPNPHSRLAAAGFTVTSEAAGWPPRNGPRRAGVSSFGIGGTNAHLVLQEPPPSAPGDDPARERQILTLSGATPRALADAAAHLAEHLRTRPTAALADTAYTLQVGRRQLRHRWAVPCGSTEDALAALDGVSASGGDDAADADRRVVFAFPGQGAQRAGMAALLYESEPAFRATVDRCAGILVPHLGFDLRGPVFGSGGRADAPYGLDDTALAQPALFVVEYALAKLWTGWGVVPEAMIGHSVGELTAACLAGVFALDDALALVAARGRLVQGLPPGSMLSVGLPEDELRDLAKGGIALAAVNGPRLGVLSGPAREIDECARRLADRDVAVGRLRTSHAFHSAMLDPVLDAFAALVGQAPRHEPRIPYVSNVTGDWVTAAQAGSPAYWAEHLRTTVRFGAGLNTLLDGAPRVLLEVGPGGALGSLARRAGGAARPVTVASLPADDPAAAGGARLPDALARLWTAGVGVDWAAYHAGERRARVPLPTYPFQRRRHWVEAAGRHPHVDPAVPVPADARAVAAAPEAPAVPASPAAAEPPRTEVERVVVAVWRDMLGEEAIGVHDAFVDLGGHSLLATQVTARLRERFAVPLTVEELFDLRTAARLSERIEEALNERLDLLSDEEVARLVAEEEPT